MSVPALKWALELAPPMPAQLVATLAGLANHADDEGRGAYPSVPTLAAYTCKAERTVRRDLRQLQELGLIRAGDPARVAHLPADRRPEVYDLAVEMVVPGGRAGGDEGTRASARTLASSRARGGRKDGSDEVRGDVDVRADADDRGDVGVTTGGRGRPRRGDVGVRDGGTWASAKPSLEPSLEPSLNRQAAPEPFRTVAAAIPEATDDEIRELIQRFAVERKPGSVKYWQTAAEGGAFGTMLAALRSERDADRAGHVDAELAELRTTKPRCPHGTEAGQSPHPVSGVLLCPACRRGDTTPVEPERADHPVAAAAVRAWGLAYTAAHDRGPGALLMAQVHTQARTFADRGELPEASLNRLAVRAGTAGRDLLTEAAAEIRESRHVSA